MSSRGSNVGMETSAALVNWSMASSVTLSITPTDTSVRCRLKSFTPCAISGRLDAQIFVIN